MNEKIKELAAQAGVLTDWGDDITVGRWSISGNYERMQKFAEFIVLECAEQVKNLRVNDYGISGAEIIREHFGVEE